MTQLVGLTGLKRSGKDSAALQLVGHHGFVRVAFADPVKRVLADLNPYVTRPTEDQRVSQLFAEIQTLEHRIGKAFTVNTVAPIRSSHVTMAVRRLDPLLSGDRRMTEVLALVDGNWDRLKEDSKDVLPDTSAEIRRLQQIIGTEIGRQLVSDTIWVDTAMFTVKRMRDRGNPVVISDCRFDNEAQAVRDAGGIMVRVDRPSLTSQPVDGHASEQGVADELIDEVIVNDGDLDDLHASIDSLLDKVRA
ncbi:MAG: hypothetical protein HLX51_00460 [Micrococcaceae bacterium]|nr:hypothetical protein [Micrococcaceae bacterium]